MAQHVDYVPTDEILDALAPQIAWQSFILGIELGLPLVNLEIIEYQYYHDIIKQAKQVLYDWRNDTTVKATLGVLAQALVNIGRGAMCLETVVKDQISRQSDAEDHDLQVKDSK